MPIPTQKYAVETVDKTKKAIDDIIKNNKKLEKSFQVLGVAGAVWLGAKGIAGAVNRAKQAVNAFTTDAAKDLDDLAKAANRLGLTSDELDRWSFAAELAGASVSDLETIFKRGSRNILDAVAGIGEGARWMEELGIEAKTAEGRIKTIPQVLFEFADNMDSLGSETAKTAAAMGLFGRSGQQLVPLLRQGSEGMRDMLIEADALNVRYGDLTRKGEDYIDAQVRIARANRAVKDAIAGELLPTLTELQNTWAMTVVDFLTGTDEIQRKTAAGFFVDRDMEGLTKRLEENDEAISNLNVTIGERKKAIDEMSWATRTFTQREEEQLDLIREEEKLIADIQKETELLAATKERLARVMGEEEATAWGEIAAQAQKAADALKMTDREVDEARQGFHEWVEVGKDDMAILKELGELELPPPIDVAEWEIELAAAHELAVEAFGGIADVGAWAFSQWIQEGQEAKIMLGNIFKSIVADAIAQFAKLALLRAGTSLFGGLPFIADLFGGLAVADAGAGAASGAVGGGNTYVFGGLTTTSASDMVRTTQELERSGRINDGQIQVSR